MLKNNKLYKCMNFGIKTIYFKSALKTKNNY